LGCNCYVNASVPDPSKIFVDVGLDFFVELTLEEALNFIGKKTKTLEKQVEELRDQACVIKANIKLTLEGLRELQGVSAQDLLKRRSHRRDLGLE
jgi:prefoldin alpha subunit